MSNKIADLRHILCASGQKIELVNNQIVGRGIILKLPGDDAENTTTSNDAIEELPFDEAEFWKRLLQASAVVSNEATKMSISFGGGQSLPNANSCKALCTSLETACAFLVSIFLQLPKKNGLTLRRQVKTAVQDVLGSAVAFIDNIQTIRNDRDSRRLQLTGCTWESCERIENLPRDNKSAVLVILQNHLELVNDAVDELQETIEGEDLESEKWSDSETHLAKTSKGLLKVAQSCLKKAKEAIRVKVDTNDSPTSRLDSVSLAAEAISPATDDFVSSLYPPVCPRTVIEKATSLSICLTSLMISISESGCFEGQSEPPSWIEFLHKAVKHNLKKVENLTGKSNDNVSI